MAVLNLTQLTEEQVRALAESSNRVELYFEYVEDFDNNPTIDLDKAAFDLHFLLSGSPGDGSDLETRRGDPLCFLIYGGTPFQLEQEIDEVPVRMLTPPSVAIIQDALARVDDRVIMKNCDPEKRAYFFENLVQLRAFMAEAEEAGNYVILYFA